MQTIGICSRSFKNMLIVKYVMPFKHQPERLKKPPPEYNFIEDEDWTIFVKERLSERFQVSFKSSQCDILIFVLLNMKQNL